MHVFLDIFGCLYLVLLVLRKFRFLIKLGMGLTCSFRHTFVLLAYIQRLEGALGKTTDRSHPTPRGGPLPPPLYRSVHLPAKLVEAQLPPIGDEPNLLLSTRNGHSWSREEAQSPPPYRCVYDPGGKFSLANKNPGVHGADF